MAVTGIHITCVPSFLPEGLYASCFMCWRAGLDC